MPIAFKLSGHPCLQGIMIAQDAAAVAQFGRQVFSAAFQINVQK